MNGRAGSQARAALWGVLLLLAPGSAPLTAQEPDEAAQQPAATPTPPAEERAARPEADGPTQGQTPGNDREAQDYEASEQISEDLSVSFPVDI